MLTTRLVLPKELDAVWALVGRVIARMLERGNDQWAGGYPTREIFAADIESEALWCVTGETGEIWGVAAFVGGNDPDYAAVPFRCHAPALSLHRLAIDPVHEGCGAATALFRRCERVGKALGARALHIDTYISNDRMQALIRKNGYRYVGDVYYDRPLPNYCYEKLLKEEET